MLCLTQISLYFVLTVGYNSLILSSTYLLFIFVQSVWKRMEWRKKCGNEYVRSVERLNSNGVTSNYINLKLAYMM
jgi:hypothetical protein